MRTEHCRRCNMVDEIEKGRDQPYGWVVVHVLDTPATSTILCHECAGNLRRWLTAYGR